MITKATGLIRLTNEGVVAVTKQQNTFVKNVTLAFILSLKIFHQKKLYLVIHVQEEFQLDISLLPELHFIHTYSFFSSLFYLIFSQPYLKNK